MAPVAGGVKRGRGLGDVLADDRDVADLAVALRRARSGRGRWRASRARSRPASARGRAARSRATDRRARTRAGRAAATASTAGPARRCRGTCRADGRARSPPDRDRPAGATLRRASTRTASSSSRGSAAERSTGARICPASAPRPRSSAAAARASSACREDEGITSWCGASRGTGDPSRRAALPAGPSSRSRRTTRLRCRSGRGSGCARARPGLSRGEVFFPGPRALPASGVAAVADFHPLHAPVVMRAGLAMFRKYSSPATEPRPSVSLVDGVARGPLARLALTRAVTR